MSRQFYSLLRHHKIILWGGVVLFALLMLLWPSSTEPSENSPAESGQATVTDSLPSATHSIWTMSIKGAIGPASADWLVRSLENATEASAELLILKLDTPGGLDKSMRDINQAILASSIPVAVYVYPKGARAASAGTYMLYAAHVAVMAPATNLGAATPVQIGGPEMPGQQPQKKDPQTSEQDQEQKPDDSGEGNNDESSDVPVPATTMERKQINDAVAYIRGLAGLRGRNADWAERAVREAVSLDAEEALKQNVIDYIAQNIDDLIQQANGRVVDLNGQPFKMALLPYSLKEVQPDWRLKLLAVITDPSVAYILMLVGMYGLIFEFYNPGLGGPGIIGAICLLIALYALQLLPISYAGLALILLGVGLMIAEAFSPSVGILGIGGLVAFIVGSVMLMDTELPAFQIAYPMIAGMAVAFAVMLGLMLHMALRSRRQAVVSGKEALIGSPAEVLDDFDGSGRVLTHGEVWQARYSKPVRKGDILMVKSVDGLILDLEDRA